MASFKPRGVTGLGGWKLQQYSYLSPAKLGLGLSLATVCNLLRILLSSAKDYVKDLDIVIQKLEAYIWLESVSFDKLYVSSIVAFLRGFWGVRYLIAEIFVDHLFSIYFHVLSS